jgi:hypothetical protein
MTRSARTRAYGHALCCRCAADFSLSGELHCVTVRDGTGRLFFFLCAPCGLRLKACGEAEAEAEGLAAAKRVLTAADKTPGRASPFAVVHEIALYEHDYDAVAAFELGTSLSPELFRQVREGRAAFGNFSGMTIVESWGGQ